MMLDPQTAVLIVKTAALLMLALMAIFAARAVVKKERETRKRTEHPGESK